jgi:hypothetical protein
MTKDALAFHCFLMKTAVPSGENLEKLEILRG